MKAVINNRAEIVELLLKVGANINVQNRVIVHVDYFFEQSTLSSIIVVVNMISFHVCDCFCCQGGETALLLAGEKENIDMVQLLLNNGANINHINVVCVECFYFTIEFYVFVLI